MSETKPAPQQSCSPHPGLIDKQRRHEYFDLLIECVVDYAFITLDLGGCITGWNIGAQRTFGYTESDIVGRSVALFFTPEDRANGDPDRELADALREGRSNDERWLVRRDGSRFWASGVMALLRDDAGKSRGFAKVLRDLSDRKRAEDELRTSEDNLRAFIDNVRDHALFNVDVEGRIRTWNSGAARLFGHSETEILGKRVATLFPPEDRGYPEQELSAAIGSGKVEDQRWLMRSDGGRFFAHWVTHPMFDDAGRITGFAKVLRDETEQLTAEQRRRAAEMQERSMLQMQVRDTGAELDRTKGELRALAASLLTAQDDERRRIAQELHDDVSQQLALAEGELIQLLQTSGVPQSAVAGLQHLRETVAALSETIGNLGHALHPSALDHLGLAPALRALVKDIERVHGIAISFTATPLPRPVSQPAATALYRIAQEALRNVVRHAPRARVCVRLDHGPDHLQLAIEDDGPGFDAALVAGNGGLGLVSMGERARLLGGTVAFRSEPGHGTKVEVTIPWPT